MVPQAKMGGILVYYISKFEREAEYLRSNDNRK